MITSSASTAASTAASIASTTIVTKNQWWLSWKYECVSLDSRSQDLSKLDILDVYSEVEELEISLIILDRVWVSHVSMIECCLMWIEEKLLQSKARFWLQSDL